MANPSLGGFRAVGLGFRALRRNLALFGFGLSVEGALEACRVTLGLATAAAVASRFITGLLDGGLDDAFASAFSARLWMPVLGLWLVIELLGAVLRVVYLAAAVVDASATLKDPERPPMPVIPAAVSVLTRAVVASLWLLVIDLAARLVRWTFIGGAILIVIRTFGAKQHGLGGAALAAFGVALAVVVGLLVDLFGRVYRVVALRHLEVSALAAAWDAAVSLGRRLGTYILIAVVGGLLAFGGSLVAAAPSAMASSVGTRNLALGILLRVFAAAIAGAWAAAVELVLVGAVCAVDLDLRGELPQPPPPPEPLVDAVPVAVAEPVLVAEAVEPKPVGSS